MQINLRMQNQLCPEKGSSFFLKKLPRYTLAAGFDLTIMLRKNVIITMVFWEKQHPFSVENCRKSHNIVNIKSTPGANPTTLSYNASVVKIYSTTNSMARF
jgi:hypothetical protein